MSSSLAPWLSGVGALLTGLAALTALSLVGWNEARKLRSQHRHEEQRKLRALIGRYHGPLLEAAIDWDRRMHQLYESRPANPDHYGKEAEGLTELEWFLADPEYFGTEHWVYGKFCNPDEYMFRSFVFRFLALCCQAREFEAQAFYIDSQVARKKDLQFLKYAKAFLWAATHGDLHRDDIPGKDHFPNDEFRPILDTCIPVRNGDLGTNSASIFDLATLDTLVSKERREYAERVGCARRTIPVNGRTQPAGADPPDGDLGLASTSTQFAARLEEGFALPPPRGIGRVIAFFIGLRRPTWREDEPDRLTRYNWDRLCVLHLLVMSFINEFGYPWQRRDERQLRRAASAIVDRQVADRFADAIPKLGLSTGPTTAVRLGMEKIESILVS